MLGPLLASILGGMLASILAVLLVPMLAVLLGGVLAMLTLPSGCPAAACAAPPTFGCFHRECTISLPLVSNSSPHFLHACILDQPAV